MSEKTSEKTTAPSQVTGSQAFETEAEARARRMVHVVGAVIVLITVIGVIWAVGGGAGWMKHRSLLAIQTVAKADLLLVHEAQKRFHAEHGFYTTDLKALNLWPKRVMYNFGFVKASDLPEARENGWNPELRNIVLLAEQRASDAIEKAKADPNFKPDAPILLSPMTKIKSMDFDSLAQLCPDCIATKDTFKMIAAANLDLDTTLDVWTIDQDGTITHLSDDLIESASR
ncbi:MAG: hypothetical protein RBT63_02560 [Bdellovibrionales bacterium]|nr:hypothetical protein [Bdellovibrionales bacterium]